MAGYRHTSAARARACQEMGDEAEADLTRMAVERGYAVTHATRHEDMVEHWDLRLDRPDLAAPLLVEVKSGKLVNGAPDPRFVWLEIHGNSSNPRFVNHGWIRGGIATHIAFARPDDFVFVERTALLPLLDAFDLTNISAPRTHISPGQVRMRPGRGDIIGLARMGDVEAVAAFTWMREPTVPPDPLPREGAVGSHEERTKRVPPTSLVRFASPEVVQPLEENPTDPTAPAKRRSPDPSDLLSG